MITWKFGYSCHLSDIASFISCWAVLPQQLAVGFRVTENFNFLVDLRLPKPPGFWSFRNLFQTVDWCKNLYHDSLKTGKIAANLHYFMRQQPTFRNLKDTSRIPQWWSQIFSVSKAFSKPCLLCFSFKRFQKRSSFVRERPMHQHLHFTKGIYINMTLSKNSRILGNEL